MTTELEALAQIKSELQDQPYPARVRILEYLRDLSNNEWADEYRDQPEPRASKKQKQVEFD